MFTDRFASESLIGTIQSIRDPLVAEDLARSKWDFACIDMQHGDIEMGELASLVLAFEAGGCPVMVRARSADPAELMRILDHGVEGVIVPMVETELQAQVIASATRYAPAGTRSIGPLRIAHVAAKPRRQLCIAMVETITGLEAVEAIAATEGIDGVMLGPGDMALSSGRSLTMTPDPFVVEAASRIAQACAAHKKTAASFSFSEEGIFALRSTGIRVFCHGSDRMFLRKAMAEQIARLIDI